MFSVGVIDLFRRGCVTNNKVLDLLAKSSKKYENTVTLPVRNEKKYASSPVLDVYDVIDDNKKTCDVKSSNKKDFDNQIQICSNDVRDMMLSTIKSNMYDKEQVKSF
ncbi:hypothetical protein MSG28_001433 [Choristoneura fumiferana]|uniref:Uncharacterized protein n=1 Tax=Choristoneura fumiferana TaxID=7141 RepID=A0ACC0KTQ9_CHOFU|nr:hypothetical protein MSG28_001433 [Choristoneura fumiferana]